MRAAIKLSALALGLAACGVDAAVSSTSRDPLLPDDRSAGSHGDSSTGTTGASNAGDNPTGGSSGSGGTDTIGTTGALPENGGSGTGEVCEVHQLASTRVTPDMLIVLDRSNSLITNGVDRWTPSVRGLKSITTSLQDEIQFGLMAFPGTESSGCSAITDPTRRDLCELYNLTAEPGCRVGSLEVPIALNNAPAIAGALDGMGPGGATPTAVTLQAAHAFFGSNVPTPDRVTPPEYVLLVTDGAPNCTDGRFTTDFDPVAVEESVAAISAMADDGIQTFVLGYDTKSNPVLSGALDRMALAGGTGDATHRPIEDEASLVQAFREITGKAISCEFGLDSAPEEASYVLVTLDGQPLTLDDPDGWSLSADHTRVTVKGAACDVLQSNGQHALSVSVQCTPVVVQ